MQRADGDRQLQVVTRLTELHGLVRQGIVALGCQAADPAVRAYPEAEEAVAAVHHTLEVQAADLGRRLEALGKLPDPDGSVGEGPPAAAASTPSQLLSSDYDFVRRLAVVYLQLQATGQASGDAETADLAGRGYEQTGYLIREKISRLQPRLAAADQVSPGRYPGVAG